MDACVLVVDDDREIVRAIALLLEKEGYRVLKAYDGMEALRILAETEVQLIIMDVMMPKLDGLSAMMKIRERKNLPIHCAECEDGGNGQDSGTFYGGGRLCGEALPSAGAGSPGEKPASQVHDAGRHSCTE